VLVPRAESVVVAELADAGFNHGDRHQTLSVLDVFTKQVQGLLPCDGKQFPARLGEMIEFFKLLNKLLINLKNSL
jgi:hypothetical protein